MESHLRVGARRSVWARCSLASVWTIGSRVFRLGVMAALFTLGGFRAIAASYVTQFTYDASGNVRSARTFDTETDPGNCGALGTVCKGVPNASGACRSGSCGVLGIGGVFTNPMIDAANCGLVGRECPADPANGYSVCSSGVCGFACFDGFAQTDSQCVDLSSDPFHCGAIETTCDGAYAGTATCTVGTCGSDAFTVPVAYSVNGVSLGGESYRSPPWKGITILGDGLEKVTYIELEDWGHDTIGEGEDADGHWQQGEPAIPAFTGMVYGGNWGWRFWDVPGSTVITVDSTGLLGLGAGHREWIKLRLHYNDTWTGDASVLVDVAVSLDYPGPVDLPPPQIDAVSVVRYVWARMYEPSSGCLETDEDPTAMLPAPTAVLAQDDREYPIVSLGPRSVCIPRWLPRGTINSNGRYGEPIFVALEWPDTNTERDVIGLGWPGGAAILRGSNLICDDGYVSLTDSTGAEAPGYVSHRCLGDRIIVTDLTDATEEWARLQLNTDRGMATTPWPLRWRGQPVITSIGPSSYVTYGEVMTLTGRWFVDSSVAFLDTFGVTEPLRPSTNGVLGPEQYRVVDDKHIAILLSPQGGPVPRPLEQWCDACGGLRGEAFPGTRYLAVTNPEGAFGGPRAPFAVDALDRQAPYAARACPVHPSACKASTGAGSATSSSSIVTSQTGDSYLPQIGNSNQDLSGRVGAP